MEKITSISNAKIQDVKKLLNSKSHRYENLRFVAEGVNIVKDIPKGYVLQLYMTEDAYQNHRAIAENCEELFIVSDKVIGAISDTKSPSGVVAVCKMAEYVENSKISIVLDGLQDPGNAGTIIRTAVACGVTSIYLFGDCVDLYSPKVVRSSMGGIFYVNVKKLHDLNELNGELFVLDMAGENLFDSKNIPSNFALLVGNESRGVSKQMRESADRVLSLPMSKNMESLNAGVSLSVALYSLINLKNA